MSGFTDIHQHLVFGVDDGPETFRETRAMVRAARRDGIGNIIATPHIAPGVVDFDLEAYYEKLERIRAYCAKLVPEVTVFSGAEIFYTETTCRLLKERRIPTLADTEYVLVEFSPEVRYENLADAVSGILRGGHIPVLAHVERYQCLAQHPNKAEELKQELDVRYQMNCSTILGEKGFFVNRFCKRLLRNGLLDAVATDAHNIDSRPVRMKEAYRLLCKEYGKEYATRLTGLEGGLIFP